MGYDQFGMMQTASHQHEIDVKWKMNEGEMSDQGNRDAISSNRHHGWDLTDDHGG